MAKRERPNAEVVVAQDDKQVQQCIDVRIEVFHREQKFPLETEIDEYDDPGRAVHFLLRSVPDHQPMGTLRMIEKPEEFKLGRLCLLKEYRGLHFGEDLVRNAHSWVIVQAERTGRPAEISLHSQIYAKTFYSRYVGIGTHVKLPQRLFLTQRLIVLFAHFFPVLPFTGMPLYREHYSEGYVEEGPEFDEDGAPHQRMIWRAPSTKGADTGRPIEPS